MNQREAREREWTRVALSFHWDAVAEAERQEIESAYLEAKENRLRRISALSAEIALDFASFRGKVQSQRASEG